MKNRIVVALIVMVSTGGSLAAQEAEEALSAPIATAEARRVTVPATYGTRIRPGQEFSVGAPISGFLEEFSVRVGDTVRVGQRVATIQRSSPGEQFRPATVESRFSGTIVATPVRPGQFVSPGQEVLRLADLGEQRLLVRVSDKDIVDIEEGDLVDFVTAASGTPRVGTVTRIHPDIDYVRGLFTVEAALRPDTAGSGGAGGGRSRIGAYGEVTFQVRPFEGVVVPAAAVTERQGSAFLFVVEEGTARRRTVTTSGEYGDQLALSSGLEPGEQYVAGELQGLREGVAVTPREGGSR